MSPPSGFSGGCRGEGHKAGSPNHIDKIYKGLVVAAFFLYLFFMFQFHQNHHVRTAHSSISIRRSLSPFLHSLLLRGKNLPRMPSRDKNSGLPYRRPAHYQLSYTAPSTCQVSRQNLPKGETWRRWCTVKKGWWLSRPQPGCHLPNFHWPGIIDYSHPGMGKQLTVFLQCGVLFQLTSPFVIKCMSFVGEKNR